ncbi:urea transporter [Undibacterium terreum]|uniref:Transporter n=1 Tax=Undibacterium terreum TaxID=1224302 RepID=A0A916UZR7_9BURK|nr:urea transporter [Undibacterium terreum]GGC94226.1 transporter [Undibacterium terreum]
MIHTYRLPGHRRLQAALWGALQSILNGISQIYFQASPLTGAVLLLALYVSKPALALAAVAGAVGANLLAYAMRLPHQQIRQGVYAYNAALSGVALCAMYQMNMALLVCLLVAIAASVAGAQLLPRWSRLPLLTAPFVLIMLSAGIAEHQTGYLLRLVLSANTVAAPTSLIEYAFYALARASFIATAPLGMLVFAALARQHWHQAIWALLGTVAAWLLLAAIDASGDADLQQFFSLHAMGLGLNCALAAQCLCVQQRAWQWRLAGIVLTLLLGMLCAACGFSCFTLPFVLACWTVLYLSALAGLGSRSAVTPPSRRADRPDCRKNVKT